MKRIQLLGLFLSVFAMMTMTSCLGDDNNNGKRLPAEQIQTAFNSTKGTHSGNIIYTTGFGDDGKATYEKEPVTWNISSTSEMLINGIPAKALASVIDDNDIRTAVEELGLQSIKCTIGYVNDAPIQWLINPTSVTFDDLEYKGAKHKVTIAFYVNSPYSYGQVSTDKSTSYQVMQIIAGALYVDDLPVSNGIAYLNNNNNYRMRYLTFEETVK